MEEEYIQNRLEEQIEWYDRKSGKQKKWFYISRTSNIILSASIPVLTGLVLKVHWFLYVISIVGAVIGIIEALATLTKLQEKWIEYRSIAETLKHEKYMFKSDAGVYNLSSESEKFKLLVERTESIISQENINWANINGTQTGGTSNDK